MIKSKKSSKIPIVYSEEYYVDIGDHVFPTSKYRILHKRILSDIFSRDKCEVILSRKIANKAVRLAHKGEYVDKILTGTLTEDEILAMELPFSPEMVTSALTSCGGTLTAARMAMERKAAIHLGGGFHHAFADHGEGFCMLNDIAVAIRAIMAEKAANKVLVVDCDLHQGNGTASIFEHDDNVFTFSIHQENNYPFRKSKSDLDIGLKDHSGDKEYLSCLCDKVPKIISSFKPDLLFYVAGADPYRGDQLGGLALTKKGLRERDNFICSQARNFCVPIAITLAGGYAFNREDTIDIHFATVEECLKVFY
jgi:acetoin utilization deacetylase AcuC-like enzyme